MTSQARSAAICSWRSVLCIESSRSCRLVAGMHSTSLVFGKGVGCLQSVICVLVSNINRLLAREWCLLSAAFVVNSRHRTAAFTASHWCNVCFVDRHHEEAAGEIAKSSLAIPPPFPEQKEKNSFHEGHSGGGVRANLKTTIEDTIAVICVDLLYMQVMQAGACCMQDIRLHACLKVMTLRNRHVDGESMGSQGSLWLTHFSRILGTNRKKDIISLTVFETKNEMRVHIRFVRTCNICRVRRVIVHMPYLPSQKVHQPNLIRASCLPSGEKVGGKPVTQCLQSGQASVLNGILMQGWGFSLQTFSTKSISRFLCSYRATILSIHEKVYGQLISSVFDGVRLPEGAFHERPPQPCYSTTWDISVVTNHIESLGDNQDLTLSHLTRKVVGLLALARPSTLAVKASAHRWYRGQEQWLGQVTTSCNILVHVAHCMGTEVQFEYIHVVHAFGVYGRGT